MITKQPEFADLLHEVCLIQTQVIELKIRVPGKIVSMGHGGRYSLERGGTMFLSPTSLA